MINKEFLKRYVDNSGSISEDILKIDVDLTNICWLPVPNTLIEPDDWNLFWKLWTEQKTSTYPEGYDNMGWDSLCIWKSPNLSNENIKKIYPQKIVDWSMHFPKMFEKLCKVMPYSNIWKITLASNTNRIPLHIDRTIDRSYEVLTPWPNSVRVLLHDTNKKPTFYLSKWPKEMLDQGRIQKPEKLDEWGYAFDPDVTDKRYVQLPKNTNTFVYSNGEFMHGADYSGNCKILVLIWGRPNEAAWKEKLKIIKNDFPEFQRICKFD